MYFVIVFSIFAHGLSHIFCWDFVIGAKFFRAINTCITALCRVVQLQYSPNRWVLIWKDTDTTIDVSPRQNITKSETCTYFLESVVLILYRHIVQSLRDGKTADYKDICCPLNTFEGKVYLTM